MAKRVEHRRPAVFVGGDGVELKVIDIGVTVEFGGSVERKEIGFGEDLFVFAPLIHVVEHASTESVIGVVGGHRCPGGAEKGGGEVVVFVLVAVGVAGGAFDAGMSVPDESLFSFRKCEHLFGGVHEVDCAQLGIGAFELGELSAHHLFFLHSKVLFVVPVPVDGARKNESQWPPRCTLGSSPGKMRMSSSERRAHSACSTLSAS